MVFRASNAPESVSVWISELESSNTWKLSCQGSKQYGSIALSGNLNGLIALLLNNSHPLRHSQSNSHQTLNSHSLSSTVRTGNSIRNRTISQWARTTSRVMIRNTSSHSPICMQIYKKHKLNKKSRNSTRCKSIAQLHLKNRHNHYNVYQMSGN